MMTNRDLRTWLTRLNPDNNIGIDDGGLTLVEVDPNGNPTGQDLELGGISDR